MTGGAKLAPTRMRKYIYYDFLGPRAIIVVNDHCCIHSSKCDTALLNLVASNTNTVLQCFTESLSAL